MLQKLLNGIFFECLALCLKGYGAVVAGTQCAMCRSKWRRKIWSCDQVVYEGFRFCPSGGKALV